MKHISILICLISILSFNKSFSQSIYGNVAEFSESNSLDYANVEIFKDDELVASLITDRNGNYNIALLDTGTYVVNVMYSGYNSHSEKIVVTGDQNVDYKLKDNPNSKKRDRELIKNLEKAKAPVVMMNEIREVSEDLEMDGSFYDVSDSFVPESTDFKMVVSDVVPMKSIVKEDSDLYDKGLIDISEPENTQEQAFSMGLTAGEINDFSKWEMWNDLKESELKYYQKVWKTSPYGRYCVQLVSKEKAPLAGATVSLFNDDHKKVWESKTDNTGKAELWQTIKFPKDTVSAENHVIKINYRGTEKEIKDPSLFEDGINIVKIKADCEPTNAVDIAFVVDATMSMQDEIDYLKLDINDVIYQAKQMNDKLTMRFSSVFYRDHGDEYLTKKQDFTKVLSESSSFIENQFAAGGGDGPEAVEDALSVAVDSLSWSEDARTKILFLVLDAPPHNNSTIQKKLKNLMKGASAKGIRIVPITGSGLDKSTEYLMRTMSLATNGSYIFLTDHSGIGGNHIAPSTDDYEVELLNELLVRLIQSYTYMPDCNEDVPEIDFLETVPDSLVVYENIPDTLEIDSTELVLNQDSLDYNPQIEEISWKYYPNPTYGPITIEVSEAVQMLFLTDMSGKIIREIAMNGDNKIQTDLSGLPMGVYFLRYPVGKKWLTGKVVLMR